MGGPNSIRRTLWQALKSFRAHQLTDVAAALTYYATMSLFPGVLLALTLLGVLGDQSLVQNAADYITRHGADPTTTQAVKSVLRAMVNSSAKGLGIALLIALALGLNSVSGAFAAAGRALNRVFSIKEDRGFVHQRLVNLAIAGVVLTLVIIVLASMFVGGQIADDLFENTIGLGSTAAAIWSIARFPLALFVALLVYGLVYAYAPDVKPRKVRHPHARRRGRRQRLDPRVGRVLRVRQEPVPLRNRLRHRRGDDHPAAVAVAGGVRVPARSRDQRRVR